MRRHSQWILLSLLALLLAGTAGHGEQAPAEPDFAVALLGDRTGSSEPQIYGRTWHEIDMLRPEFVVNVGDTIQGGNDATAEQEWQDAKAILARYRRYPLFFTAGNHDIWSAKSRALFEQMTGRPPHYSFDWRNLHVAVLDTSRTAAPDAAQLEFLAADLGKSAAQPLKVVVFHHPFWIEQAQSPLHELARKHGVQYIVSGHGHRFYRTVRDGVTYLEVGSAGGTMRGKLVRGDGFAQGCFYHFLWGRVRGGELNFTVKELGPPAGLGRMFPAEDWNETGPLFDTGDPAQKHKPGT